MTDDHPPARVRVNALLLLAIANSALFFVLIRPFIVTLVMAAVMAGMANGTYERLRDRLGGRQSAASAATVLLALVLIIAPALAFLGIVVGGAVHVSAAGGQWVTENLAKLNALQEQFAEIPLLKHLAPYQDRIMEHAGKLASNVAGFVANELAGATVGAGQFIFLLFVALYAMYYFLMRGRVLVDAVLSATPLLPADRQLLTDKFMIVAQATVKGTLIVGMVQGGLAGLSFWWAGIPAAPFWSVVMAVLSIIPGVGAALIWIPAVIVLALGGHVAAAVGVALWCALIVSSIDNVLRPRLVGKTTEMPDLLVLLTTLGGLFVFGMAGLVVGPIIGALFVTVWKMWGAALNESRATLAGGNPAGDASGRR